VDHPDHISTALPWLGSCSSGDAEVDMDWMKQLGGVLDRYADPNLQREPDGVHDDYDRFAQAAPPDAVADGLAAAFRSDRTPPFPQMASQMFGRAGGAQRASILNMLLATVGPMVLQQILARRQAGPSSGAQGGVLGQILRGGAAPHITPEAADQLDPKDLEEIAQEAEKKDPSIVDKLSQVYAQNPQLVKMLGGAALAIALGHMSQRRSTR
jgi:hypothetical protein